MNLSRQFLVNIFSSWYAHAIRIAIAFFFVPYITSVLGDARYGVWVIVFQVVSYFTLLDLGVAAAVIRYVSRFLGDRNFDRVNRVLNTATVFYIGAGIVAAALIYLFASFSFDIFKIEQPGLADEGAAALGLLGILIGFRLVMLPFGGSFAAFQRQDLANVFNVAEELIRTLLMVILLASGYGLLALAAAALVTNVVKHILAVMFLKQLHPEVRFSLHFVDRSTAATLFNYSRTAFGISLAWVVIYNSDSLLLGIISSSSAAGIFNPAVQAMYHLRMIINAVGIPLTPAVSHLEATAQISVISDVYLRGLKYTAYLSFLVCTGVVLYAKPFISLWLMPEFYPAAEAMQILAVSGAFFLPQILGNSVLLGLGRHNRLLFVLALEVLLKVLLAIVLIKRYGLNGMAVATALPQLILYTTIYPFFVASVLKIRFGRIMKQVLLPGLLASLVTGLSGMLLIRMLYPDNWTKLFIGVGAIVVINLFPLMKLIEKQDKEKLLTLFKRRKNAGRQNGHSGR